MCDASVVVALLLDAGPAGHWAAEAISGASLLAPSLIRFECANVIRRHERAELITGDVAAQAHADVLDLPIEEWPYEVVAARVWGLRRNLSSYDASYVAVAELAEAELITLDRRLQRAPGIHCPVRTP